VAETITVDLPRAGFAGELAETLRARGLDAELVDEDDRCTLRVRYSAGERERLAVDVTHAVEGWRGERRLPLVVERTDRGCVLRPPAN
jgi:hypothetical protein